MSELKLAVAQPFTVAYDVAANARAHAHAHAHASMVFEAGARVVVFPELSLTGYELDAPVVAVDDPRLAPLVDACAQAGCLALAGAPVQGPHIAMLAVTGSGVTVAYRKQWPARAGRRAPSPPHCFDGLTATSAARDRAGCPADRPHR